MDHQDEELRRESLSGARFQISEWRIDPAENKITCSGKEVSISPKAMDLLLLLARSEDRIVRKEEIFEALWPDTFVGDEALWKRVSELRQAFGDDAKELIVTIPKRGYRLAVPVERGDAPPLQEKSKEFGRGIVGVAGAALFLIGAYGLFWLFDFPGNRDVPLDPPSILVAEIENRTEDSAFEGSLRYALEQELLNQEELQVVSRTRIRNTLRLMQEPEDTPLRADLALQLCLRDGRIDYLLSGRIERVGRSYQLGLRILDPESGSVVAAEQRTIREREETLEAVQSLASWALEEIGGGVRLRPLSTSSRRVSTASLEAYQLFLQAVEARHRFEHSNAEILTRRAVEIDPNFTSAYRLMAEMLMLQGKEEEASKALEVALQRIEFASLPEKAYIRGLAHDWSGEFRRALPHYEVFLDSEPGHPWAIWRLLRVYRILGRSDLYEYALDRYVEENPTNPEAHLMAAALLLELKGDLETASVWVEEARRLVLEGTPEALDPGSSLRAYLHSFGIWRQWLDGDLEEALRQADQLREALYDRKGSVKNLQREASFLGQMYLTLGKIQEARRLMADFDAGEVYLPEFCALLRGEVDEEEVRQSRFWLLPASPTAGDEVDQEGHLTTRVRKMGGLLVLFRLDSPLVNGEPASDGRGLWVNLARGGAALRDKEYPAAIENLQEALRLMPQGSIWNATGTSMTELELARAYEGAGRYQEAIEVLERLSSRKTRTYVASGSLWILARGELAELYLKVGDLEKAEEVAEELRRLLKYADPDHPVKVQLVYGT